MREQSCRLCGQESTSTYCPSCEDKVLEKTRNDLRNSGVSLFEQRSLRQAVGAFVICTLAGLPLGFLCLRSVISGGDIIGVVLFTAAALAALFGEAKVRFLGYEEVYSPHEIDGTTIRESWETVTLGRYLSLATLFLIFLFHWFLSGDPILVPFIKVLSYINKNFTSVPSFD